MLESGSPAPPMVLEDTEGQTVRLSDYQGTHAVLVYFMRSTSCPVCNSHVRDLVNRGEEFAADNVRVLVAVPEDRETAARWKAKRQVPFPVLTGRAESPHEMVGLGRKVFGSMRQSGSILVDRHGVVRHAHGATMPTSSYDKKGIAAAIASLRTPA
ncbi:Peroxiredoxin [Actinokineospora alba]|uniref:thioredoxin-dependent peroxiredoxin n=1 Tax=Actinokineospora alba TaxID=504798 RepID=A0A1H0LUL1_9PSEU|nr:peroxiredoxin family protein [Actinokineospora alba]TDP67466.1 peroxiredoxin [Actinokineospora alba]SDI95675.1 Peroxiredoxin [Actinokineospora alba]SDO71919.1 Peroxiredoxin [Actinokineospora alba]